MAQPTLRIALQVMRPVWRPRDPAAFFRSCRCLATSSRQLVSTPARGPANLRLPSNRTISTSQSFRATVVVRNPRVDDDGNDMTIEISERAAKRLKQITTAPPTKNTLTASSTSPDSHLRVTVTSGGCHGFQYLMSLEGSSKIDHEEDTIFSVDGSEDSGQVQVVMDSASLELLKGSTVDFTTELIGSQFKIVGNPRATSSCGCGTSFDIE